MVDYLFQAINSLAGKYAFLDSLMIILAKYLVIVLAGLLVYLFIKDRKKFIFVFLGMIVSLAISKLIGFLFYTPRPFVNGAGLLIEHAADSSFPSDHAAGFFSVAFALFFLRKWKTGIVFLVVALLVGFARIFTGLHYLIDILGGVLVAGVGVVLVYFLFRRFSTTKRFKYVKTHK